MPYIRNTGDGSCLFHTISVQLFDALMSAQYPLREKNAEFSEFLQYFATYHLNFNPATPENLQRWLQFYCATPRDIELLISPVLRVWYEHQGKAHPQDIQTILRNLPKTRHICEEEEALDWLCEKLGFNLFLQSRHLGVPEDRTEINGLQPGPAIQVNHVNDNHFDTYVSDGFIHYFKDQHDSLLLAHHHGKADGAYTFGSNPLPEVKETVNEIMAINNGDRFAAYQNLKAFQHHLQMRALKIKQLEAELQDSHFDERNSPIYTYQDTQDNYVPDHASLVLMFSVLKEEAAILDEAEEALKEQSKQKSRL